MKANMKKHLILLGMAMSPVFMSGYAMAAIAEGGQVDLLFSGVIQEQTCSIVPSQTHQNINFGALPPSVGKGESPTQNVVLSFTGCPTGDGVASKVAVTLTADQSTIPDAIKIVPSHKDSKLKDSDIGIQLYDKTGQLIKIGEQSDIADISGENIKVMLNAKVKGNGTTDAGTGDFTANATLNVAYL